MDNLIQTIESPGQIVALARRLREAPDSDAFFPGAVMDVFEKWAAVLHGPGADEIPGVAFLRLWLRRGTLEPILQRELGAEVVSGGWRPEGRAKLGAFPLGVVGHWPAGNIEIQPVLSMSCALIGGNSCLVRVPSGLLEQTRGLVEKLWQADKDHLVTNRVAFISFDHARSDLQDAMAQSVDGAMIWGGAEAVSAVRALPFPHWARLAVFGPRLSVAAMDAAICGNRADRAAWCQRIARDVWQFDQQACSSPQTLFMEKGANGAVAEFIEELRKAFAEENRVHPREVIHPSMTSAICLARSSWLLDDVARRAYFPDSLDWTILCGSGSDIPQPIQGRTLYVMEVDDLMSAIAKFGGAVQTMGLAISDAKREEALARAAGRQGVDRIVKLGRMHVFGSPWDGSDLIRPMVRMVRHVSSSE